MCGIGGIISNNVTKFNVNDFNILGSFNDERGGDSCGIFIDGLYKVGVKNDALFRNFTESVEYPSESSIALVHCRKASAGYIINESQAQPVVIKKDNKIEFVLMHNGTITNSLELAKKYIPNFSTWQKSDSQIMAQIMYECGFDVLEEYEGSAVFVMVDYRQDKPDILFFKGSSCYNELNSKSERPLYCMVKNDKFYFSSMYISLRCISYNTDIYDVPCNQLLYLENNKFHLYKNFNRNKLKKKFTYNTNYNNTYTLAFPDDVMYDKDTNSYKQGKDFAHGHLLCFASGYKAYNHDKNSYDLYFFYGKLLSSEKVFNFLTKISKNFRSPKYFYEMYPEIVDYFSFTPIRFCKSNFNQWYKVNEDFDYCPIVNGSWYTLFIGSNKYTCNNDYITCEYVYSSESIKAYCEFTNTEYNFKDLEKRITNYIKSM